LLSPGFPEALRTGWSSHSVPDVLRLSPAISDQGAMSAGRIVLLLIAGATILRLILAGATGLGVDESYMASNARVLSLSYFDHPPLHVWLTGLAARLFGSEVPFVLRLPFILLFAASTWLLFRLTERLFGANAGLWAVIAFSIAPVFSIADGMWILPDGPLVFFLLASANVVAGIVLRDPGKESRLAAWIFAGVLGGLALLSKYSAIFFFAATFAFLLTVPAARRWLRTPGPWLGAAVAAILFLPVIFWNVRNGLAGLDFQGDRFSGAAGVNISGFLSNFAGQAAYITPWLFAFLAYGLVRGLVAGPAEPKGWFIALLAVGPIVVFTLLALSVRSFPHWPMPGWLFAFPLLGREAARLSAQRPGSMRAAAGVAVAIFVVATALFSVQAIGGDLARAGPLDRRSADPTVDLVDWTALPRALQERGLLGAELVVAARDWITAGKASYALPGVPVLCLCSEPHHFAFRDDPRTYEGRNVVLVYPAYQNGRAEADFQSYFESLTPLEPVKVLRAGEAVLELDLLMGSNLRTPADDGR
jgi:4-amino-4-deoxy-L-arabinose transferase-like glycosyltransferase